MIKTIIFDVGGTYLEGSFSSFINKSKRYLGIDKIFTSPSEVIFDVDFNTGRATGRECFEKLFNRRLSESEHQQIVHYWTNTWILNPKMGEMKKKLSRNFQLSILSNSDPINSVRYAMKGWYDLFDPIVLSHEEGILKPDKKIFEIALKRIGRPPDECLLIDDEKINLETAKKLDMEGLLYEDIDKLEKDLEKFIKIL